MLRLGVDAWNLPGDRRGIGRYVRALLREFATTFADRVECTLIVPEWATLVVAPRYRREVEDRPFRIRSRRSVARAGLDVLWFPFNGMSWDGALLPAVATLHDASPFVLPGYDDAARAPFLHAARRCTRIITDSRFCAAELAAALPFPPERIDPIPLGVGPPLPPVPIPREIEAFQPFVLFVGEAEPRKGLMTLASAVERVRARGVTVRLVAVGRIPPETKVPSETVTLGHVDDVQLTALYRACGAFAYPSRYEGFGLPVLEAMSYEAPVVASSAAGIPEAGGDAARYVAPDDVSGLADALYDVLRDPTISRDLRARGRARAAAMTWRATAAATLTVLESASSSLPGALPIRT